MEKNKIILTIILIIAFIIRIVYLSQPNFFYDEAWDAETIRYYREKGTPIWVFSPTIPHSLDYLKVLPFIFEINEFTMRFYSVVAGVLSVFLVYLLGKELYNKKLGIISALLLAVCPLHVVYSKFNFRDILPVLFIIGAILLAEKFFKNNNKKFMMFSAVFFSLAFLSKISIVIIWAIYWCFIIYEKRSLRHFIAFNSISLLFIILIRGVMEGRLMYFAYFIFNWIFSRAVVGATYPFYYYFIVMIALSPLIYLAFVIAIFQKRIDRNDRLVKFIILAYLFVIMFIQARRYPRYIIPIIPFIMILIARFTLSLKKYGKYVLTLLVLSSLVWTGYEIVRFNNYTVWTDVDSFIKDNYPENKVLINSYDAYPLIYYIGDNSAESINTSDLNISDLVVLTRLFPNSTLTHSPFENDYFSFLTCGYYQINRDFYINHYVPYVKNNGILLKTFENWGTDVVWLYQIKSVGDSIAPPEILRKEGFILRYFWDFICDVSLVQQIGGVKQKCSK